MKYIKMSEKEFNNLIDCAIEHSKSFKTGFYSTAQIKKEFLKDYKLDKSPALQLNREEVKHQLDNFALKYKDFLLDSKTDKKYCKYNEINNLITAKILSLSPQGFKKVASGTQEEAKKDFINWITFKNPYKNLDIYIKENEAKNG